MQSICILKLASSITLRNEKEHASVCLILQLLSIFTSAYLGVMHLGENLLFMVAVAQIEPVSKSTLLQPQGMLVLSA